MKKILVVDDEQSMCETLKILLEKEGFSVDSVMSGEEALELFHKNKYDLLLTDLKMNGISGIELIESIGKISDIPMIIMTAHATKEQAIKALNLGASFFIEKPFKKPELMTFINRSMKIDDLIKENNRLKAENKKLFGLDLIIGYSKPIIEIKELIKKVAASESNILISGESGTGKELVAKALHSLSTRAGGPFVAVNCGAIPDELLESELFGHVKGSFTGAVKDKIGLMEEANGGTFFLDEVGNTSLTIQMKILRAIQEKEVLPVGGQTPNKVDIRIIAATNENLDEAVNRSSFRKDLYYRLNVINIHIPPLRERREDIELLLNHFLKEKDKSGIILKKGLDKNILEVIKTHDWPGNIRELENVVERLMALSHNGIIDIDMLPDNLKNPKKVQIVHDNDNEQITPSMEEIEKAYIHWILVQHGFQKQKAAEVLGIGRSTLDRKIERYGLDNA